MAAAVRRPAHANARAGAEAQRASWARFAEGTAPVYHDDVPWLPGCDGAADGGDRRTLSLADLGVAPDAPSAEQLAAVKEATLFWHPDKWQQRYGDRLTRGGDAERILEAVSETSRKIVALRASVKKRHIADSSDAG